MMPAATQPATILRVRPVNVLAGGQRVLGLPAGIFEQLLGSLLFGCCPPQETP